MSSILPRTSFSSLLAAAPTENGRTPAERSPRLPRSSADLAPTPTPHPLPHPPHASSPPAHVRSLPSPPAAPVAPAPPARSSARPLPQPSPPPTNVAPPPPRADLEPFPCVSRSSSPAGLASAPLSAHSTVQLSRHPIYLISKAVATALALGPVRHLRVPGAWGGDLPQLLDSVLPALGHDLISLDLSHCNLRIWPKSLRACTCLEELVLSDNPLGDPPAWLGDLRTLRLLTLDRVGLSGLPTECAMLDRLTSLSLAHNRLTQPPIWLYRLPHLQRLCIDANPFEPPWTGVVAPLLPLQPRASTSSSADASLLDSPTEMSPNQIGFSSPFLTSASTIATSNSFVMPSPRDSRDSSDGDLAPKTPTKSFKLGLKSPSKMLSTISLSPTPQRWTARLKRAPKAERAVSNPVRPLAFSPGVFDAFLPTGNTLYPRSTSRSRSVSGPAFEDTPSPSRRPSNVSEKSQRRTSPQSCLGLGWPSMASLPHAEEDESETRTRRVKTLLQYLQDLDSLHPPTAANAASNKTPAPLAPSPLHPFSPQTESGRSTTPPSMSSVGRRSVPSLASPSTRLPASSQSTAPLTSLGTGSVMTMNLGVSEHVLWLQSSARNEPVRRSKVLEELIGSEETYVEGLQVLVDVYVAPCRSFSEQAPLPMSQQKIVFGNVEAIFFFHKSTFLPALRKAASPLLSPSAVMLNEDPEARSLLATKQVAQVFSEHAAFLRTYAMYTINCDLAQQIVMSWGVNCTPSASSFTGGRKRISLAGAPARPVPELGGQDGSRLSAQERKTIHKYLKKASADPRTSALGLDSYLLLPVQRIPRYRLMLEDLLRCVAVDPAQEGDARSASESVAAALASILKVAQGMNEAKRQAEQEARLYAWHEHFLHAGVYQKAPLATLIQPRRRLLKEGVFTLERLVRPGMTAARPDPPSEASSEVKPMSRSGTVVPPWTSASVPALHQELVGDRDATLLLCNDLLLILEEQGDGPNVFTALNYAAPRRRSSAVGVAATPSTVPTLARSSTGRKFHSQVRAVVELAKPSEMMDQLMVEGSSVRVRDGTRAIYYLSAPSEAVAAEWASSFQSAADDLLSRS